MKPPQHVLMNRMVEVMTLTENQLKHHHRIKKKKNSNRMFKPKCLVSIVLIFEICIAYTFNQIIIYFSKLVNFEYEEDTLEPVKTPPLQKKENGNCKC